MKILLSVVLSLFCVACDGRPTFGADVRLPEWMVADTGSGAIIMDEKGNEIGTARGVLLIRRRLVSADDSGNLWAYHEGGWIAFEELAFCADLPSGSVTAAARVYDRAEQARFTIDEDGEATLRLHIDLVWVRVFSAAVT